MPDEPEIPGAIGVPPSLVFNMPANPWLAIMGGPPKDVSWYHLMDHRSDSKRLHVAEIVPNDSMAQCAPIRVQ